MIIFPNIELQNGKCVNLVRGEMDQPVVYDVDPVATAKDFAADGAHWLHVVDLDAVAQKESNNAALIEEIIHSVHIPVQVAGGIRTHSAVEHWMEKGAGRVVIGTAAVVEPQIVKDAAAHFPNKVVVSVDARGGQVVCEGWKTHTAWTPLEFARQFELLDLAGIIFTDIDRDADHPESTLATTTDLASSLILSVISSGTVKSLDDISTLHYLPNIAGAIVGRAIFNGTFTLRDALGVVAE